LGSHFLINKIIVATAKQIVNDAKMIIKVVITLLTVYRKRDTL
jgi:hypothetical protein